MTFFVQSFSSSATTLHFEFNAELKDETKQASIIHVEHVDMQSKSPAQLMDELVNLYHVPLGKQSQLLTQIRLTHAFSDYRCRLQYVQARLKTILIYSNALADAAPSLLYTGKIKPKV
jgi:hypothetical protein